jgi:recombination protein RecA
MGKKKVRQVQTASDIVLPGQGPSTSDALKIIAGESKELPTMARVLQPIRFIPTILTSFNRAIVIGGAPVRATWVVHGPTASGKTVFALAMVNSFVQQGHLAAYIDAEHAVSKQWFEELGADMSKILFEQPDTFEETVDLVDMWIANFKKGKKDGKIPQSTAFIIVIDVIHKLVPKRELAKLSAGKATTKDAPLEKGWGRYRANLISVWIDKLTPLVGKEDVAFLMLAHERGAAQSDNWFDPDYKVKGGTGLMYDAMVRVRIDNAFPTRIETGGAKKLEIGKAHHFTVAKNKVGYPNESGKFYTSNGKGSAPLGFDFAREIFIEAEYRGFIKTSGSYLYLPSGHKVQGRENTITYIRNNPEVYESLYEDLAEELEEVPAED